MADPRLKIKAWRMAHLYFIKNRNEQIVRFKRNRAQVHFNENRWSRNIILKSRRLGFTTDECIDALDDVLFSKNFDALFIADKKENAVDIFDDKIQLAWEHFPLQHLYGLDMNRANKLKFDFGDKQYSSVAVRTSGRSGGFRRVHISELGPMSQERPAEARALITGTIPAVPIDGRVDIESTAAGETGEFYDMFWEAWGRKPTRPVEYKAHFYNWTWDDEEIAKIRYPEKNLPKEFREYQKQHRLSDIQITYWYYQWIALNKDWNRLLQEYPTTPEEAFIRSGSKLFDVESIERQKQYVKEPQRIGDWRIFHPYVPGHDYVTGADTAEGVGADSNTAAVLDCTPAKPRFVATYRNNMIEPDRFAFELRDGSHRYGTPVIGVERNNHGHTTLAQLKTIYPVDFIYAHVETGKKADKQTDRLGFPMNGATKPALLYELKQAVDEDLVEIADEELLRELRTYDRTDLDNTRKDPAQTKHWDLLIAAAIAWYLRKHRKKLTAAPVWKQPDYVPSSDYEGG